LSGKSDVLKTLTIYLEALAGEPLVPGIIVVVQTFGDRINFHPHLHLLVTEGGMDRAGIFQWSAATVSTPTPKFIRHLKLTFVAEKPPPAHVFEQTALMAGEESGEYE